jgi:predicted pyridoxine 5'-phosphate oxidase superfamily flavin-nucleotide-binding protein
MGKVNHVIDPVCRAFIEKQHVFFVATAPSGSDGHVNLSPKGLDTFRVLDERTVAYLDFVGSGAETIAHLGDNGRIVLMFCAFDGPPNIVRLHGRGETIERPDARFGLLRMNFPASNGVDAARAIIVVRVSRASHSCGYGVPLYAYEGERPQLEAWSERKGPDGIDRYQREKNAVSLDGLPGLRWVSERPTGE